MWPLDGVVVSWEARPTTQNSEESKGWEYDHGIGPFDMLLSRRILFYVVSVKFESDAHMVCTKAWQRVQKNNLINLFWCYFVCEQMQVLFKLVLTSSYGTWLCTLCTCNIKSQLHCDMEISIIKQLMPLKYSRLWMSFSRLVSKRHISGLPSSISFYKPLFESKFSWFQESRKFHMLKNEEYTALPYETLRKTIRNHFVGFQESNTCLVVDCPGCLEKSSRSVGKLTINSVTGFSFCTRCFLQGNWSSMDAYLKELERSDHSATSITSSFFS